ncbi:CHRD domain-containing protein [Erythrobacter alti]|uniref:CHRD domain-containing protein n=1 Tax=Erythrobacter alti TaxID=1896145 RepID=UPI0030F4445B
MKHGLSLAATAAASLALAGCATLEEAVAEEIAETYYATLTGAAEVGGGDTDGYGTAEISISDELGQVCWDINDVRGIGPITAAHIHRGAAGVDGPVVFTLRRDNTGDYTGCTDASEWTQEFLEAAPGAFYVNVHTAEFPNGAIRGQLRDDDN